MELSAQQESEMARLKTYYPYRIIYAMIHKDTKKFSCYAVTSMRIPNKFTRDGHEIFIVR